MKTNVVLRKRGIEMDPFLTPEEKVDRLTGSISSRVTLEKTARKAPRKDEVDRILYTTNTIPTKLKASEHKFLTPLKDTRQQMGREKDASAGVNQAFYWGHEKFSPRTRQASQLPPPKATTRLDAELRKTGGTSYSRQLRALHHSQQGGSCPTQIYSRFKLLHSEKMLNHRIPHVNINSPVQVDHNRRRMHHLQPLRLAYSPDSTAPTYYSVNPADKATSWTHTSIYEPEALGSLSSAASRSHSWPQYTSIEERHARRWSPQQHTVDPMPSEWNKSIPLEDEWNNPELPAPPPNSVTPSALEMSQAPPNTPHDW